MERSGSGSRSKSAFSDWSHLPPDIVQLISEKFKSITDYLRFRAVCSPWRSASLPRPRHLPPQLPWLMLTHKPYKKQKGQRHNGVYLFYDLERSKLREVHLPETTGMVCCASYQGWLLLLASKGREVLLLNPITRARIQLPPFTALVKRFGDGQGGLRYNTLYLTESEC
ncbi:F-box family protein [Rhynchospora pubera]|uniref:F-box family protein n=1 Tax=Rhynchospora pubera TaxID=906938 RepID=A0AAV8EBY0_9POAL|nr:F-box family protein [Rhynchospora pubera]